MNSRDDLVALVGAEQEWILEEFAGLAVQVGSPDRLQFWQVPDRVVRHEVAAEIVLYPALRQLPGGEVLAAGMVRSQNLIQRQIFSRERGGIDASRVRGEHHRRPHGRSRRVDPRLRRAHGPSGQLTGLAGTVSLVVFPREEPAP